MGLDSCEANATWSRHELALCCEMDSVRSFFLILILILALLLVNYTLIFEEHRTRGDADPRPLDMSRSSLPRRARAFT
jgi:hypothetical protein